jgi:hypothetical protein
MKGGRSLRGGVRRRAIEGGEEEEEEEEEEDKEEAEDGPVTYLFPRIVYVYICMYIYTSLYKQTHICCHK